MSAPSACGAQGLPIHFGGLALSVFPSVHLEFSLHFTSKLESQQQLLRVHLAYRKQRQKHKDMQMLIIAAAAAGAAAAAPAAAHILQLQERQPELLL